MLTIQKGQKVFTISDSHFGHDNIRKYCNRPFKTVDEMDEKLIENWNNVVCKNDVVFHLGDFSFRNSSSVGSYLKRLNGTTTLLMGNHDKFSAVKNAGFYQIVSGHLELRVFDENTNKEWEVFLFHYHCVSWNASFHGRPHLFGHVHSGPLNHPFPNRAFNSYDVGVDNNDFTPVNMIDLLEKMKKEFDDKSQMLKSKNQIH